MADGADLIKELTSAFENLTYGDEKELDRLRLRDVGRSE